MMTFIAIYLTAVTLIVSATLLIANALVNSSERTRAKLQRILDEQDARLIILNRHKSEVKPCPPKIA